MDSSVLASADFPAVGDEKSMRNEAKRKMAPPKDWTLPFALVVGVVGVALLFPLKLEAVAESSDRTGDNAPIQRH